MQKITPFLWFNERAEEAAEFYASLFPNASWEVTVRKPDGSPMVVAFKLGDIVFNGLNGGPHYTMTPGTSFLIHCGSQEEVDHYWDNLAEGGEIMQCGWLTDRFGVTWQIVPQRFLEMMSEGTAEQAAAVMAAIMEMKKLEIAPMEAAFASAG